MGANYAFYMKTIETHARTFLALSILAIGRVSREPKAKIAEAKIGYITCDCPMAHGTNTTYLDIAKNAANKIERC